jgi:chromosomal replication initiation ATPase DnaA
MYLCPRYTGQRLKDIGRHFDIGESGVSQASRRVIQKKKEDKQFIKRIEKIEKKISSK